MDCLTVQMPLKVGILIITGFVVALITSCDDSGPTANDTNSSTPDTVSYNQIYGKWEGAYSYQNPNEDSYESDSVFVTSFQVNKKRAAVGDSVGFMKWNNKDEYCEGLLTAEKPSGDTLKIDLHTRHSLTCDHLGGIITISLRYFQDEYGERIKWYPLDVWGVGFLYPKE